MRTSILVAACMALACGNKTSTTSGKVGPVYTPALQYAIRGMAADCLVKKTPGEELQKEYTCRGRPGTVTLHTGDGDHLRDIDIKLYSFTLPQAKAFLEPALTPILGQTEITEFSAQLSKLASGERTAFELAGARIDIFAGGTDRMAPEYAVTIKW